MILKLKRTPGIYLVGFMACGKTVIGRMLAESLGWKFVDIDDDIEAVEKVTIAEIFDTRGESEFRRLETDAVHKRVQAIEAGHPTVVALGGGAFSQTVNYELIRDNGISIWLDCPLSIIHRRVEACTLRPLARDPDKFDRLYYTRRESYARADFRIEILGDDPRPAVNAVLSLPLF